MINLYYCPTPNCQIVSIALEELGLPYQVHPIDSVAGDHNQPEYAAICPNRKVPAIVDPNGPGGRRVVLCESAAMLTYLAEKAVRSMKALRPSAADQQWDSERAIAHRGTRNDFRDRQPV